MTAGVTPELSVLADGTGKEMGGTQADLTVSRRPADEGGATRDAPGDIEWVSIPQLAERLGMAKESVYRLARAGQLRGAVKMGRRYVVNYSAFVEASRAPMTPAALRS
jgi:excisionase family DNA binding protein